MSSNLTIPVGFAFDFANLSSNCSYRFICFRQRILQGTNALCFQLLTLIAAYWLQIGPIVPTSHPIYNPHSIFKIILQKIQHKMSFQKGLQIIGLPSDPIVWSYQVISPQQNSYCLWLWWSRQKLYLENCPAFNGSPVTSWGWFQKYNFQNSLFPSLHFWIEHSGSSVPFPFLIQSWIQGGC